MGPKDSGDGGGRHPNPQAEEFSLDPLVAPPGVLPGQTEHEVANIRIDGRPAGRAMRPGPLPPHEVPVPPEQGLRPHQEGSPLLTREQPAHSRQEDSVARPVDGAPYLSPQDREFVAENQDLQVLVGLGTATKRHQPEQPHEHHIEEGQEHEAGFSQTDPVATTGRPIAFSYPTRSPTAKFRACWVTHAQSGSW